MATELGDLKGVGSVAEERLNSAGVESIDDLAQADAEDLEEAGMSDSKANRLIQRAKQETVLIQTGDEVVDEYSDLGHIKSGMNTLDDILGGGYQMGNLIAIAGPSGSGKTQMVFQALVSAVYDSGDPVAYIETERHRYAPQRLKQLAKGVIEEDDDETTPKDIQEKIYRIKAYDLDQQRLSYEKLRKGDTQPALVVVDSFTANFRLSEDFEGRSTLSERSVVMGDHLRGLGRIADDLKCPILITGQVYGNPSGYGSPNSIYGGSLFMHTVNYIIMMANAQGSLRKAKIMNHPEIAEEELHINITENELEGMRDV